MDDDQQFCLRWNNHQSTLISVFDTLLENETLVDCTLAAEGKFLKAHKVVLSACSPYFATLLQEQYDKHPIFILKDVKYQELRAMMDYMYRGEVNISQDQLAALLKAAESLQIKGLSDNRTGGGSAPKPESSGPQHHRGGKLSGAYTLEQTKRARLATSGALDTSGDVSGSREGSSSPSRRRRKVRRRSMENDAHDNSNSSVLQAAASNQSILQQTGAGLAVSALVSTQLASGPAAGTSSQASSTQQQQPLTSTNVTKKTESAKLTSSTAAPASGASASAAAVQQAHLQQAQTTSDAINTENVQAQSQGGAQGVQGDDEDMDEGSAVGGASAASGPNPASASASAVHAGVVVKQLASVVDKSSSNHKQKIKDNSVSSVGSEMVIEPKAEYDDDAHDENVEDLTLDEEDMTMEELDQTAGTSQGGEGSSQTYATWQQHDRSQDELGLMAQDAQQRDPQDESGQHEGGESRIRVRNWLMLADQSVIEKSSDDSRSDKLTQSKKSLINDAKTTNKSTTPIRPRSSTTNNTSTSTAAAAAATVAAKQAAAAIASSNINNNNSSNSSSLTQTLTQTVTRIGSIGRTTIACITPANNGNKSSSSNCNVDAASAAALAAAGVELDSIDDTMTEVIVKIENPESMPLNGDDEEAVCNEAIEDENTYDYDLKLGSPLSWTYDAVKIENEEFEDSYLMDNDDDDDDLLTTAAATQKHAKQSNEKQMAAGGAASGAGGAVKKIVLSAQQQQQLLEQQQHLQHLQLQPTSQSLQIKLPAIPATITTISAPKQMVAGAGTSGAITSATLMSNKLGLPIKGQNLDLHWSHSDDNRYRVLVQNKRTRKESLEHSADMIYNADIEKPWVCRNCNRTYKWKNSLKCHLKNECGLPPRYFCSKMCGYATNVHSNLKRHLNTKCRDREKDAEEEKKPSSGGSIPVVMGVGNGAVVPVSSSNNNGGGGGGGEGGGSSTSSTYTLVFQNDSA
ncbi:longitudinals lacking protein, isoforms J/P/Q/S/Z isoform X2 [Drosophila ficusphila]|uniref:longitudinals lacking protein, isoforms J/P/Q/S/Z isoform X2 n=1 Tax=Drosophila ficusphila TaxID=30025 RepID=UPI0007E85042|nr:longitudinals lacking protein, isoforms J/P/Q/S/Z isoform X2 [Drosophila ficusphila]